VSAAAGGRAGPEPWGFGRWRVGQTPWAGARGDSGGGFARGMGVRGGCTLGMVGPPQPRYILTRTMGIYCGSTRRVCCGEARER
jgi:hypothetical protein